MATPKITIITVVYNGASLIEATIKSVLEQNYAAIEYIVIDGQSKDNTLEVINKYSNRITKIVSEKDSGIYDAMNKGLKLATGDYVLFLNAGDLLFDTTTISSVFASAIEADIYYGNTAVIDLNGKILGDRRLLPPDSLNWKSLKYGMCVSHQSFIPKRLLCDFYSLEYKISSDIDWVIKALKEAKSVVNTHTYISKFLEGGTSNNRRKLALKERFLIMVKHYGLISALWSHFVILLRYPIHRITKKSMT
jgi:glycosyltransferase involved in cell wall biosynthesis